MSIRAFVCVAMSTLLCACGNTINGKALAEPEVATFHALLQARDFEGMFQRSSADFQAAAPKEQVLALYEAIDRKLGPLQETQQVNWNVNTRNMATTVVLVYQSRFERGDATETFTYRIRDGGPELMGYNIASLDMLIR